VVMTDGDAVGGTKAFEGKLGVDGSSGVEFRHQMDIGEVGEVVDKHSSAGVTGRGGGATVGG